MTIDFLSNIKHLAIVDRFLNFIITSALFTNAMEWVLKVHFNEFITVVLGIGALPILVYKIIKSYSEKKKSQHELEAAILNKQDMELHLERERLEIDKLRKQIESMSTQKKVDKKTKKRRYYKSNTNTSL
jgi:hypothetical protein